MRLQILISIQYWLRVTGIAVLGLLYITGQPNRHVSAANSGRGSLESNQLRIFVGIKLPVCPDDDRKLLAMVTIYNASNQSFTPIPGARVVFGDPKLGSIDSKEGRTDFFGVWTTTYHAEQPGQEKIDAHAIYKNPWNNKVTDAYVSVPWEVTNCWIVPLINGDSSLDLKGGNMDYWITGGGEARRTGKGQYSGDGEITLAESITGPCIGKLESSGTASFTIQATRDDQAINLDLRFSDVTIPPKGGCGVPDMLPGDSGDPGVMMGIKNEFNVPADGGSVSFPYPIGAFSGDTTIVVMNVPEESGAAFSLPGSQLLSWLPIDLLAWLGRTK